MDRIPLLLLLLGCGVSGKLHPGPCSASLALLLTMIVSLHSLCSAVGTLFHRRCLISTVLSLEMRNEDRG